MIKSRKKDEKSLKLVDYVHGECDCDIGIFADICLLLPRLGLRSHTVLEHDMLARSREDRQVHAFNAKNEIFEHPSHVSIVLSL